MRDSKRHPDDYPTPEQFARLLSIRNPWMRVKLFAEFPEECPAEWVGRLRDDLANLTYTRERFAALKAGFRAGIPANAPVDQAAAARLLDVMVKLGGTELMGDVTTLPDGIFVPPQP